MKKTTRTLLGIGGAFCLIGALLFGIGFVSGGTKYVHATNLNAMNAQSDQDAKENHFTLEKTELSDFNSLNVSLKNSDFNIKESPNEKSYIEYMQETTKAKNPLSYSIKNNTLTLKENGNTGASYTVSVDISFLQPLLSGKNMASCMDEKSNYKNYVTLYLPKGKLLSSAKVNLGYGDFSLNNSSLNTADITLDDGDFIADTITVNSGTISLSYGDCDFKKASLNTADITLDDGDFIADTITVNSGTISLSYGDCDFKKASLSNTTIKSADGDISMNNLYLSEKVKLALSYGDAMLTLNDSTKKTAGFDLITHYGTINTSSLTGSHTAKDDEETFKSEPKDGKTTLSINSEDGDITIQ